MTLRLPLVLECGNQRPKLVIVTTHLLPKRGGHIYDALKLWLLCDDCAGTLECPAQFLV
jgi:hypothetical protein